MHTTLNRSGGPDGVAIAALAIGIQLSEMRSNDREVAIDLDDPEQVGTVALEALASSFEAGPLMLDATNSDVAGLF